MKTETINPASCLESLGLTLAVLSGPMGEVKDNWPCIAYDVELQRKGRRVWAGPYNLGIGHVKEPKLNPWEKGLRHMGDKQKAYRAAELAKAQKVSPKLADVVHSLLLDGSPAFDGLSFEDWASEYGYSDDSIKAKEAYDTCLQTGLALRRAFNEADLAQLREAFQDY